MNPLRETPHPLLLEVAARPWLRALAAEAGRPLGLADVPDDVLDGFASRGFRAVWLMGVWETGPAARALALTIPELRSAYERVLPDWEPSDVAGSPYALSGYRVAPGLGGDAGLARLRERLAGRGIALVLDFVPNHLARDHRWLAEHPSRFVRGTARDLARDPGNWFVHTTPSGEDRVFAHGRDPHFPGWTDTAQLDYRAPETHDAMTETLLELAGRCDGLRCDMAMLALPDVFRSTWGDSGSAGCFWSRAIPELRARHPDVFLIAEVYWGLEERLHGLGFDATYDKELYDRLVAGDAESVHARVSRPVAEHRGALRFLENHDEPRARETFGARYRAAAAITYSLPGIRFFLEGQAEGRRIRPPVQLTRAPREEVDTECLRFHEGLFAILRREILHRGTWAPLELPGADEALVGNRWSTPGETVIVVGNLGAEGARVRIPLDRSDPGTAAVVLEDLASGERFERFPKDRPEPVVEVPVPGGGARFLRAGR